MCGVCGREFRNGMGSRGRVKCAMEDEGLKWKDSMGRESEGWKG